MCGPAHPFIHKYCIGSNLVSNYHSLERICLGENNLNVQIKFKNERVE